MTANNIDKILEEKNLFLDSLAAEIVKTISSKVETINSSYAKFTDETERLLTKLSGKREYDDYINYLLSDDFEAKEKNFATKVRQTILDNTPQQNSNLPYVYIAVALIFAIQVALLVYKFTR